MRKRKSPRKTNRKIDKHRKIAKRWQRDVVSFVFKARKWLFRVKQEEIKKEQKKE